MPVKRWRAQPGEPELAESAEMTAARVKASARTVRRMRYHCRERACGDWSTPGMPRRHARPETSTLAWWRPQPR